MRFSVRALTFALLVAVAVFSGLLLTLSAQAQSVLSPPAVCTVTSTTKWDIGVNDKGLWASRWLVCKEGGEPIHHFYAATRGAVEQVLNADGAVAASVAFGKLFLSASITEPVLVEVYAPDQARIDAGRPRPPPAWTVAKYSLQTTRPAYPVVNGVRSSTSTGRAAIGAACDCAAPLREGLTTYCPFTGSAGSVAVCAKP